MRGFQHFLLTLLTILSIAFWSGCSTDFPEEVESAYVDLPKSIDFNFHIRPILSDRCFSCHGPDAAARKAGLRLDLEEEAFAVLEESGGRALVGGSLKHSVAFQRMITDDPELKMPPPESKLSLTPEEIALIAKWIRQGAEYKPHWAFIPLEETPVPDLPEQTPGAGNEIDHFVRKKLADAALQPNPEADRERLIRRVALDLTGLPPTVEEIDAFVNDNSPAAYENLVDRLLQTDAHAERMAMEWMDVARYADSHGMHADGARRSWPWRDWVIKAFEQNLPYDDFVTWQLAGDLLPNATDDQVLATAFNRNHPMTAEGGVIEEEFRLGYVFDRTETMSTLFMGLTLGCAKCHDHKFDPFSQKEYYEVAAFFNNVKELGMTGDDGDYGPMMMLASEEQKETLAKLDREIEAQKAQVQATEADLLAAADFVEALPANYRPPAPAGYFPLDRMNKGKHRGGGDKMKIDGKNNCFSNGKPTLVEGKVGQGIRLSGDYDELYITEMGQYDMTDPFSVALWINTTKREPGLTQVLVGNAGDKNNFWRGWDFYLDTLNRLSGRLIHSLPHNYIHVQAVDSIPRNQWRHVAMTYDGSGEAAGIQLYIDGNIVPSTVEFDQLYKSTRTVGSGAHKQDNRALRIGKSYRSFTGENGIFKGVMDELRIYNETLLPFEIKLLAGEEKPAAGKGFQLRTARSGKTYRRARQKLAELRRERMNFVAEIPEIMVMEEMPQPRPMFVLNRGEYDSPMQQVEAAVPNRLLPFPGQFPKNRLGLSQWLFAPDHPLTARVTVNRYWQMIFGQGLVKTPEDFGVQGALPTHPALLDWLALDFIESGWDLQALLKKMVMSATYRQSSDVPAEKRDADPENLLLARGPSYRLPAEMIRDNALAASGLLVATVGGESVRPYQPPGLWIEKGNFSHELLTYKVTKGDSLYRRSMYTFVKRTSPHPAMVAFDAPNRDVCTVRREKTNTPLQSLVLLNDPQFVEAARVLAERMQKEGGKQLEEQIDYAFRLVTGRSLADEEKGIFQRLYESQLEKFSADAAQAKALLKVGEFQTDEKLDPAKTAALAMVASTMFNHDDAYMKR